MIDTIKAIHTLYPQIVVIRDKTGYDADGNEVEISQTSVDAKLVQLQAEETARQEAEIIAKESALSKLTALGLTADEVKALLGVQA